MLDMLDMFLNLRYFKVIYVTKHYMKFAILLKKCVSNLLKIDWNSQNFSLNYKTALNFQKLILELQNCITEISIYM